MRRFYLLVLLAGVMTAGCSSAKNITAPESAAPPAYTITYVIHGDANYLYHDTSGNPLQADEQVLAEAKGVARQAKNGEVFIFHQQPERKILWLFPKKDRQFLYYRNGNLVHEQNYSPHSKTRPFKTEAKLYRQLHTSPENTAAHKNVLLYFGHEVPQQQRGPYHYSRPQALFDIQAFAKGVRAFLPSDDHSFDLLVLSTCNNGTPAMISALSPFSDYVLASPQNLHLSHIDTQALSLLNQPGKTPTAKLAESMAHDTYQRLASFLQTVLTLTVYEQRQIQSYLPFFSDDYNRYINNQPASALPPHNVDCATLSFFDPEHYKKGIQIWYKAPRFGSTNAPTSYSGWGCQEKTD